MLVLIGYIVAFGCIFGMYVLHGGSVGVLVKALPFEMVTIGGGALGAFIVSNQPKVLKATAKAIPSAAWLNALRGVFPPDWVNRCLINSRLIWRRR